MALLTITEQQAIKPIVQNWALEIQTIGGLTNFQILENEVEESVLADVLGLPLLQDLQDNPETVTNLVLLNGGSFVDCNDNTVKFKGVRYALAYMIHYRYPNATTVKETAAGLVRKNSEESNPASVGEKLEYRNYSKDIALREFELIKSFLNENSTDYPLWVSVNSKHATTPIIRNIKRTYN